MTPIDYSQPANILGDEAIGYFNNELGTALNFHYEEHGDMTCYSINLAIHQYERLKEVCLEYKTEFTICGYCGRQENEVKNPTYTKIVEVLVYLNSLK